MPRDLSGNYTLPLGNPVIDGTIIDVNWANPTMSDIAVQLNNVLTRDGLLGPINPILFPDGSAAAPAMSFASQPSLGWYKSAPSTMALGIAGVAQLTISPTAMIVKPPTTFQAAVTFSGGATLTGPITVDKLYSNAPQSFNAIAVVTPDWQMAGTTAAQTFFGISRFNVGTAGPSLTMAHSRNATVGTFTTALSNGDQLGLITFLGGDGTSFREGARIAGEVDGTVGTGDMPGRLRFYTTPDGTATATVALTLANDKLATFAGSINTAANITVTGTLVAGANIAPPANTHSYIDGIGGSVLPALIVGTALTIARSAAAGNGVVLQLVSGNAGTGNLFFGDTDLVGPGRVAYDHATNLLSLYANSVKVIEFGSTTSAMLVPLLFANGTAAAPSIAFVNDPDTGFYRPNTDIIGVANAGLETWRWDAAGRYVGGGTTAQVTRIAAVNLTPQLQNLGTDINKASAGLFAYENVAASNSAYLAFARSRNPVIGSHTLVLNGDAIGRISFAASDAAKFVEAARIQVFVDGAPGLDDMPGAIAFLTTPDGAAAPTTALVLHADKTANFSGLTNINAAIPTLLELDRSASATNASMAFITTSGSVFIGQGPANRFAVGSTAILNVTPWLDLGASSAKFNVPIAQFNGATQGVVGILEGTGSGATVNINADTLVLDGNGNAGLSILSGNAAVGSVYFGDIDNAQAGRIAYSHLNLNMSLVVEGANVLVLGVNAATFSANVEVQMDASVGPTGVNTVGFRGIPQVSKSIAYTLVLSDAGKHIYHPSADVTARIFTIPANSAVAFPIGTQITFVNDNAAGVVTISITTDTLRLAGAGTTGSRTLAANGIATALKLTATSWIISGTGLT